MYVSKKRLQELVIAAQAGNFTEEFAVVVDNIARGLVERYHYRVILEDYIQDCIVTVMVQVQKLNPSLPCFNYLTTVCQNTFNKTWRQEGRERSKIDDLRKKILGG